MKINRNITLKVLAFFLFSVSGVSYAQQQEKQIIQEYLQTKKQNSDQDFNVLKIQNDKALKGKIVSINQTINNIPVYGAVSSVLMQGEKVNYMSDNFIEVNNQKSYQSSPTFDVQRNFASILSSAQLKNEVNKYTFEKRKHNTVLSELVYFPEGENLRLSYVLNFYEDGTNNYWNVIVDAKTGKIIDQSNLTVSCNFSHDGFSHDHQNATEFLSNKQATNVLEKGQEVSAKAPENASYRVFALPIEAPTFGDRTLVTNPWFDDASPLGWHNDGDTSYTVTRGNNVYAYADETGYNTVSAIADGGNDRKFDFDLDVNKDPYSYKEAAITNLFYLNNKMHDIFYRFGFDEEGGNFQADNFGKGDEYTDADPILAEAFDGSGLNNANFSSPPDGYAGRMQMYLWQARNFLNYNSPEDLTSRKPATGANSDFGPLLTETPITSDVVLANPLDACSALDNTNLTGKIALIERGTCNFDQKFKSAQDKGAVGVIIYNPSPTQAVGDMVGSGLTITIPGILVDNEEGNIIKSKLQAGINVNVSLQNETRLIDGSLDNGIIAHEYGHGISLRNTGNGYSCLNPYYANEQMGEGWSDFFALMVTNKEDAASNYNRGTGTFVTQQTTDGRGIRPAQYSPDFNINSYTYGDTNGMAFDIGEGFYDLDVHSIGFVWATMLWDLHWKFADKYGFSNDIANNPNSGSAKVVQLVYSALKLQGCNPSFVKGRDAIIAADQAINNGENKCLIWNSFAKRGLGVNANPGKTVGSGNQLLPNISDQVEDFSVPMECSLSTNDADRNVSDITLYPNPASDQLFISLDNNKNISKVDVSIFDITGKRLITQKIDINKNEAIDISSLANGVYVVKGEGVNFTKKLIVKK